MSNSIRLDSFLVSSSAGMDLTKGVPEKRGEVSNAQLKDELSFEKSLDQNLKADHEMKSKHDASSNRQGLDDSKKAPEKEAQSEQGRKSEEPKAQVKHKEVHKEVSKAQTELSEEASIDEEVEALKPSRNILIDMLEPELSAEVVAKNSVEAPKELLEDENLQDVALGFSVADMEMSDVVTDEASEGIDVELPAVEVEIAENPAEEAVMMESKDAIALPAELQPVLDEAVKFEEEVEIGVEEVSDMPVKADDSINSNSESEFLDESFEESDELSFQPTKEQHSERATDVKDFAAELWIHRNVDAESKFGRSDLQVQLTQDSSAPKPILMRDLNPLISKVITTSTGGEMSLQLRPGHLGNVKIDILVEAGSVRVNMQTEKAAAQNVLQSQVGELKQQFSAVGLKVDSITINTSQGNASEQAKDGQQQHSPRNQQEQAEQRHAQRERFQSEFEMEGWNEEAA